jgi:6-phosphogluconate dehydrogenase
MNSTGNDIGVIGLGVMGANLLMNMAERGSPLPDMIRILQRLKVFAKTPKEKMFTPLKTFVTLSITLINPEPSLCWYLPEDPWTLLSKTFRDIWKKEIF